MKNVLIGVLATLALLGAAGCNSPHQELRENSTKPFYDVQGTLYQQIALLDSLKPTVTKTAMIDGKSEEKQYQPEDSAAWLAELQVFLEADINKPILFDQYILADGNGGNIQHWALAEPGNGIQYLRITHDEQSGDLLQITAAYKEKNTLFTASREMTVGFLKQSGNLPVINAYRLKGTEKIILKDTVRYEVEAHLSF